jgi:hypothetical protein
MDRQLPLGPLRGLLFVGRMQYLMKRDVLPARLALILAAALLLFATPLPALAQSCALCYTQAASSGGRMIQALKSGILILIIPPTLMSIAMIFIMYRSRNRCRDAGDTAESDPVWKRALLSNSTTSPWPPPAR